MRKFGFQEKAIGALKENIQILWHQKACKIPIVFKAPTGSGKTYMVASAINEMVDAPEFSENKAYIWITFSDTLAMQSMDKFKQYFGNMLKNELLLVDDIDTKEKLDSDSILFLNWQKLTQNKTSQRKLKLRKPKDINEQKEDGLYFDDFIDNTIKNGTNIILIIDESHRNATTELAVDIIDYINPKIIINISATPKIIPSIDDVMEHKAGYVKVKYEDVVNAGLIREKILLQSKDELNAATEDDLDLKLLEIGMKRRELLKSEYEKIGKKINPLMIIQLPNDDSVLKESGVKTKEEVVIDFFEKHEVNIKARVAIWCDGREINMEHIDYLESDIDYMLFKQTAGTGWDCPRAQVMVMFREIQTSAFYVQTVGRILRMTEPDKHAEYKNYPMLRRGYLYTNYHRDDVELPGGESVLPVIQCTHVKNRFASIVETFFLQSDYISRVDYGDFVDASVFQRIFVSSLCKQTGIELPCMLDEGKKALKEFGIDLSPKMTTHIMTNTEIKSFDNIVEEINKADETVEVELSINDIEKYFNFLCVEILKEQTSLETKVGNIARSWSPLKSALRVWFKKVLPEAKSSYYYKIFIYDLQKGANSKFRVLISNALKEFYPIKKELLKNRDNEESKIKAPIFSFNIEWCYDETFEKIDQEKNLLENFYLKKDYKGKSNEIRFAHYLDQHGEVIWWYKNGDSGSENFSVKYYNTREQQYKLFYPDWLVKLQDGRIGIFDTKLGNTLTTDGRAKGLQHKLKLLGKEFFGGIVNYENNIFVYCDSENYNEESPMQNNWKILEF